MEQLDREEGEAWSAIAWTMVGSWTDSLESRIAKNPDAWFRTVKNRCEIEAKTAAIAAAKPTVEDLSNAVAELGELFAAQDDAIVELAELIAE